jgi:septation ring formation regulator EzrA
MVVQILAYIAISLCGVSVCSFILYFTFFLIHQKRKNAEYKIKEEFNSLWDLQSFNSYKYLERISSKNPQFNEVHEVFRKASERRNEALISLKDKISKLDVFNINGDYKNSKSLADQLLEEINVIKSELKVLKDKSIGATGFAIRAIEMISEYKSFFQKTVAYYESEVTPIRDEDKFYSSKKFIEDTLVKIDSLIEVASKEEILEELTILQNLIDDYSLLVYKTPKIHFIYSKFIPSQIQRIESKYAEMNSAGYKLNYVRIFDLISQAKIFTKQIEDYYSLLKYSDCETYILSALTMIDNVSNYLSQEEKAHDLLERFNNSVFGIIKSFIDETQNLRTRIIEIQKDLEIDKDLRDKFRILDNSLNYLYNDYSQFSDIFFFNSDVTNSEVIEKIYNLFNQISEIKHLLETVINKIEIHVDLISNVSVSVANSRLVVLEIINKINNYKNKDIEKQYLSIALNLKDELSALEQLIFTNQKVEYVKKRVPAIKIMINSLIENITTLEILREMAESLIIFLSKYRNESQDIAKALLDCENRYNKNDFTKCIKISIELLKNIQASAKASKISLI